MEKEINGYIKATS